MLGDELAAHRISRESCPRIAAQSLVERFDIEPFPGFSAK
jgi:hypothetical protein